MKHIKLAVVSVLVFAAQGAAHAQFPADAEASYSIAASNTYADLQGGKQSEAWGVGKRDVPTPHNAFPFGGGVIDD